MSDPSTLVCFTNLSRSVVCPGRLVQYRLLFFDRTSLGAVVVKLLKTSFLQFLAAQYLAQLLQLPDRSIFRLVASWNFIYV